MPTAEMLVGREPELRTIHELVDGVAERGGALVLRGEPGIGKSALLAEASRYATSEGLSVLAATGAQSEARLPFAGLHQLLRPVLAGADELPLPQRDALRSAFGMEAKPADAFLIALGALELLSEHAAQSPVLVVVEDAHWVDDPTSDVVSFIARRIESEPIVLLIATREDGQLSEAGLEDVQLEGIAEPEAGALLDATAPDLAPEVRRRLLDEARGNPLALVELPKALAYEQLHGQELLPERLPLSDRLERAFATRFADLPAETRRVLVFAAADDGGVVEEVLGAAGATLEALEPAVAAGLVEVDHERLRFHHPLVRSAIYQEAGSGERQAAHAALAREVAEHPDRSVWHRAAAAAGPDDQLARDLLEAALRARNRGAPAAATAALERAAELTVDEQERGGLFIQAAEAEWELGRVERSLELLARAKPLDLRSYERLRLSFLAEVFDERVWTGASPAAAFAELAKELMQAGRPGDAIRALELVAVRSYWGNPDQETRDLIVEAADALLISKDNTELIFVLANADTLRQGARVLRALTSRKPVATTPDELFALAASAYAVWSFDISLPLAEQAVNGLRGQGRLGPLAQALTIQAWAAVHLANAPLALAAADEAIGLGAETRQVRWSLAARMAKATILAERGQLDEAEQVSAEVEATLLQMGASPLLALVQFTRGRGAVAHQQYDEGRDHLERIFDPGDTAYHPLVGALGLADLVDACVHLGDHDGAAKYLAQLESLVGQVPGTLLLAQLAYARALVADEEETYQEGLSTPLATWPCYRGRLLLAYGSWLRRQRRVAESRAPLRAAKEIFDGLGFDGVAELARQELRASGETSRRRAPEAWDQLSPQELQIARMAAEGLTNREIGQKLFLSHRTVGSHLYRMFPKLGVTSRGQLAAALQSSD